jgi:hypothetical protein
VDWFCLFEMIWGAFEMMDRGRVANWRRATGVQLVRRQAESAYGWKEGITSWMIMPNHPEKPVPIQKPPLSDFPSAPS